MFKNFFEDFWRKCLSPKIIRKSAFDDTENLLSIVNNRGKIVMTVNVIFGEFLNICFGYSKAHKLCEKVEINGSGFLRIAKSFDKTTKRHHIRANYNTAEFFDLSISQKEDRDAAPFHDWFILSSTTNLTTQYKIINFNFYRNVENEFYFISNPGCFQGTFEEQSDSNPMCLKYRPGTACPDVSFTFSNDNISKIFRV